MSYRVPLPPLDVLNAWFEFHAESGSLTWRRRPGDTRAIRAWNTRNAGKEAGCVCPDGYVRVGAGPGKTMLAAHRIVWKMHYGSDPVDGIAHRNGDLGDNRICNLVASGRRGGGLRWGRPAPDAEPPPPVRPRPAGEPPAHPLSIPNGKSRCCVRLPSGELKFAGMYNTAEQARALYQAVLAEVMLDGGARPD